MAREWTTREPKQVTDDVNNITNAAKPTTFQHTLYHALRNTRQTHTNKTAYTSSTSQHLTHDLTQPPTHTLFRSVRMPLVAIQVQVLGNHRRRNVVVAAAVLHKALAGKVAEDLILNNKKKESCV